MSEHENVESVMEDISFGMVVSELEKRGLVAVCVAKVAGEVMKAALEMGVPYSLAQEMAQDYWHSEMLPVTLAQIAEEE